MNHIVALSGGKDSTTLMSVNRFRFVLRASYGNDSMALIWWAHENCLTDVCVLYSDTQWAVRGWMQRVEQCEMWAHSLGFTTARTASIGMEALVRRKKMWPQRLMQFCTKELKIIPTMEWLDKHDPEKRAIVLVGVRREESSKRVDYPSFVLNSANDGGRCVVAPLVDFKEADRDALLARAGVIKLPHRSMECRCINSGREDIKVFGEFDVGEIERIEQSMGVSSKGKPCTMFRPNKFMGAVGIREIVRWANSPRGKYEPPDDSGEPCDSGWCER